jgi:hypothetical protein
MWRCTSFVGRRAERPGDASMATAPLDAEVGEVFGEGLRRVFDL